MNVMVLAVAGCPHVALPEERLAAALAGGQLRQAIAAQEPGERRARRTGSSGGAARGAPR
jgi:hypothetical protein